MSRGRLGGGGGWSIGGFDERVGRQVCAAFCLFFS